MNKKTNQPTMTLDTIKAKAPELLHKGFLILLELLPFLFFILLNEVLNKTHGQYHFRTVVNFTLFSLSIFSLYVFDFKSIKKYLNIEKTIYFVLILFALYGLVPQPIYHDTELPIFAYIPFCAVVIVSMYSLLKPESSIHNYFLLGIIVLFLFNLLYLTYFYEKPFIDIWYIFTDASKAITKGINPYNLTYPDIYNGLYTPLYGDPHLIYWPLNVFFCFTGYLLGDVRIGLFIAICLTLVGLYKLGKLNLLSTKMSLLICLVFLCFSVTTYEYFYSWTETFLFPFMVFSCYYYQKRNFVLLGVMLGLLACTKQSVLMYLIMFMSLLLTQLTLKDIIKLSIISLATFIIIMLPFVLLNPVLFYKHTVTDLVAYLPRLDSFSWVPHFIQDLKMVYHQEVFGLLYMGLCLVFSVVIYLKKTLSMFFFLVVVLYFVIFMTAKQSFCNYYYLLEFLALLWVFYSRVVNENNTVKEK